MKTVKNSKSDICYLAIPASANPEFINGKAGFKRSDLDYLGKLSLLTSALDSALGNRLTIPYFDLHDLRIDFLPTDNPLALSPEAIVDELMMTANELKLNAVKQNPLPSNNAVTFKTYVPILYAIAKQNATVIYKSSLGSKMIPILSLKDFIPDVCSDLIERKETFLISGAHKSTKIGVGHGLLLTDEKIFVQLPADDPKWALEYIEDVLRFTCYLEHGIYKNIKKDNAWHPYPNSKIVRQDKIMLELE